MNYRGFYEKTTGVKVPKDWHIHHINTNRNDNRIENLVAVPRRIHLSYHSSLGVYKMLIGDYISQMGACFKNRIPKYSAKYINKAEAKHKLKKSEFDEYVKLRDSQINKTKGL